MKISFRASLNASFLIAKGLVGPSADGGAADDAVPGVPADEDAAVTVDLVPGTDVANADGPAVALRAAFLACLGTLVLGSVTTTGGSCWTAGGVGAAGEFASAAPMHLGQLGQAD